MFGKEKLEGDITRVNMRLEHLEEKIKVLEDPEKAVVLAKLQRLTKSLEYTQGQLPGLQGLRASYLVGFAKDVLDYFKAKLEEQLVHIDDEEEKNEKDLA